MMAAHLRRGACGLALWMGLAAAPSGAASGPEPEAPGQSAAARRDKKPVKSGSLRRPDPGETVVRGKPGPAEVSISVGKTFRIELDGNPTTGFGWTVTKTDARVVAIGTMTYVGKQAPGLVGSGGVFVFPVKGLKAGTTEIALAYSRSWESLPPARTFTVKVKVRPAR